MLEPSIHCKKTKGKCSLWHRNRMYWFWSFHVTLNIACSVTLMQNRSWSADYYSLTNHYLIPGYFFFSWSKQSRDCSLFWPSCNINKSWAGQKKKGTITIMTCRLWYQITHYLQQRSFRCNAPIHSTSVISARCTPRHLCINNGNK